MFQSIGTRSPCVGCSTRSSLPWRPAVCGVPRAAVPGDAQRVGKWPGVQCGGQVGGSGTTATRLVGRRPGGGLPLEIGEAPAMTAASDATPACVRHTVSAEAGAVRGVGCGQPGDGRNRPRMPRARRQPMTAKRGDPNQPLKITGQQSDAAPALDRHRARVRPPRTAGARAEANAAHELGGGVHPGGSPSIPSTRRGHPA